MLIPGFCQLLMLHYPKLRSSVPERAYFQLIPVLVSYIIKGGRSALLDEPGRSEASSENSKSVSPVVRFGVTVPLAGLEV